MVNLRVKFTETVTLTRSIVVNFEGETEEAANIKAITSKVDDSDPNWIVEKREVHHVSQRNLTNDEVS